MNPSGKRLRNASGLPVVGGRYRHALSDRPCLRLPWSKERLALAPPRTGITGSRWESASRWQSTLGASDSNRYNGLAVNRLIRWHITSSLQHAHRRSYGGPAISEAVTLYVKEVSPCRVNLTIWPVCRTWESGRLLDSVQATRRAAYSRNAFSLPVVGGPLSVTVTAPQGLLP